MLVHCAYHLPGQYLSLLQRFVSLSCKYNNLNAKKQNVVRYNYTKKSELPDFECLHKVVIIIANAYNRSRCPSLLQPWRVPTSDTSSASPKATPTSRFSFVICSKSRGVKLFPSNSVLSNSKIDAVISVDFF